MSAVKFTVKFNNGTGFTKKFFLCRNFFKYFARKFHLANFRTVIFRTILFHIFKNTFYPKNLHWLLQVLSNENYFIEIMLAVYSISIIKSFAEAMFDRSLICFIICKH